MLNLTGVLATTSIADQVDIIKRDSRKSKCIRPVRLQIIYKGCTALVHVRTCMKKPVDWSHYYDLSKRQVAGRIRGVRGCHEEYLLAFMDGDHKTVLNSCDQKLIDMVPAFSDERFSDVGF